MFKTLETSEPHPKQNKTFFRKFLDCTKGSPVHFFDILPQTGFSKSPKSPPFAIFGIVRFFKMIIFVLKFGFPQWTSTLYSNSIFFKTVVFSMRLWFNLFLLKPLRLFLETKRFASIKDSLGYSELCYIFRKKRIRFFFQLGKDGFRVLSSTKCTLSMSRNCFLRSS